MTTFFSFGINSFFVVVSAEIDIGRVIGEHMPGSYNHGICNGHDSLVESSPFGADQAVWSGTDDDGVGNIDTLPQMVAEMLSVEMPSVEVHVGLLNQGFSKCSAQPERSFRAGVEDTDMSITLSPSTLLPSILSPSTDLDDFVLQSTHAVELVLPVQNAETEMVRAVGRIYAYLSQKFPFSFHLTILDNASDDGTTFAAAQLADSLPGVGMCRVDTQMSDNDLLHIGHPGRAEVTLYCEPSIADHPDEILDLVAPFLSAGGSVLIDHRTGYFCIA